MKDSAHAGIREVDPANTVKEIVAVLRRHGYFDRSEAESVRSPSHRIWAERSSPCCVGTVISTGPRQRSVRSPNHRIWAKRSSSCCVGTATRRCRGRVSSTSTVQ